MYTVDSGVTRFNEPETLLPFQTLFLEYIFSSHQQNKDTEVLEKGNEFCVVFSCF